MTELSGVVTIFNADEKYIRSVGNLNYGVSLKVIKAKIKNNPTL